MLVLLLCLCERGIKIKTLMILGSAYPFGYVITYCNRVGIKTVVCDSFADSPMKCLASKAYTVDVFDFDALAEIARENAVDGIYTASSDILLYAYVQLCAQLGLPCTISPEQLSGAMDKRENKRIFLESDILTAKYTLLSEFFDEKMLKILHFPLIIKPPDSSGGKGMRIVQNIQQVREAVPTALACSVHKIGYVVAEEYLDGDEVNLECWVENSQVYLLSVNDKDCIQWNRDEPVLCLSTTNPSKFSTADRLPMFQQMAQRLADALGVKNGPLTIQTIIGSHGVAVLEPLVRLAGGNTFIILGHLTGVNTCTRLVNFALGLPLPPLPASTLPCYTGYARCLILFLKEGHAARVHGLDEIEMLSHVLAVERYFDPDRLPEVGHAAYRFAVVHFFAASKDQLEERHRQIVSSVQVLDEQGNEMLINKLLLDA